MSLQGKEGYHDEHSNTVRSSTPPVHRLRERYRHDINHAVLFTDGAKFLADQGGAYWLLDIVAIAQQHDARVSGEEFQVWNLRVHSDRSATVFRDDGNGNPLYTQEIPYTDFPLDEVKLYFANNVIHLPSEY
jgi:hypothetical protein